MPSLVLRSLLVLPLVAEAQLPVPPPSSHATRAQPAQDLCPLTIFIDGQGRLFDSRFGGRYHVTEKTLQTDVLGGCKERGPTSSVRIQASPQAKFGRLKEVMDLVRQVRPDLPVSVLTPKHR